MDEIIADAGRILGIIPEHFKGITVEPVQPILCTEPKKTFAVLHAGEHGVIGKAILHLVVPEIVRLTGRTRGEEKEEGKYETVMDQSDRVVSDHKYRQRRLSYFGWAIKMISFIEMLRRYGEPEKIIFINFGQRTRGSF
jgi:hypothetical protein